VTVKKFSTDGKSDLGLERQMLTKADTNRFSFGFFRDLSGPVALQRSVSTVCLTVSVRSDTQNARQTKRFGVEPFDAALVSGVTAVGVALAACVAPALRATCIDPRALLRE
jgi:hypothetical protein